MKKKKSLNLIALIFIGVAMILIGIWGYSFRSAVELKAAKGKDINNSLENNPQNVLTENEVISDSQNETITDEEFNYDEYYYNRRKVVNEISDFDLSFLKLENQKENKIYSPLSIKYALKMLEQGAVNTSRWKITKAMGNRDLSKYVSNNNMSFANAFFIKDSYKDSIDKEYIENLNNNHNAEIIFDSFETPDNINSWVNNKTFKLIDNLVNEENMNADFMLINALAIDMEWKNKFLESINYSVDYSHENFYWGVSESLLPIEFDENKQKVSGMEIIASINNYDIVSELGEENIRNTVHDAFIEYTKEFPNEYMFEEGDFAPEKVENTFNKYFYGAKDQYYYSNGYISQLNSNYRDVAFNTDFSLYVDNTIKVFAKDLKEYDGTTLQYVGIMPISESLDSYITNLNEEKINNVISNLKELRTDNFKDGVITKITGFIPKFKFEYELDFKEDLKKLGIGHIFEQENAELDLVSEKDDVFIYDAIHKSVIEFTQDGIKAAAATSFGGGGGGDGFDYIYEVPVEEIDLTFNKPYMFLIRDKDTGELWFTGTVYEPFPWAEEDEIYTSAYQ